MRKVPVPQRTLIVESSAPRQFHQLLDLEIKVIVGHCPLAKDAKGSSIRTKRITIVFTFRCEEPICMPNSFQFMTDERSKSMSGVRGQGPGVRGQGRKEGGMWSGRAPKRDIGFMGRLRGSSRLTGTFFSFL